ncbi:hypothetical protein [Dyella nitratireducens]|uniref:DUF1579 domain-containing protein n=1 Tax=Dyella nitratireducens TaxID=1849580 RepID=A0ABQ1FLR1_9GAMM|nr:hypothetical protein [Dyella nitratireducens]GGA20065.1 hypothetical protein GCM10010981_05110 [Dyella nitratireducens]GLQ44427.1 hypothetical protein GCM10007902_42770 [Dyella nitratireducens]
MTQQLRQLVLVSAATVCMALTPHAFGASASSPCANNTESRQLDFWIGDWAIGGQGAATSASSHVSLALDKCAIIEQWDGGRGHRGENIFAYSADDKNWHGMFVDNEGRVHIFLEGKASSDGLTFLGPGIGADGASVLNRVRIIRIGPNRVDQLWEKSADHGKTWSTAFHGEYSRKNS